ncbi:MAG: S-methyl-5-thioribose kinase, partial [Chloroflexi bacterium]|nr:S-methyl-5-thioribose kinase [Chloroflexota bacterium]
AYRQWLLDTLRETWLVFETEFSHAWERHGNGEWPSPTFRRKYMRQLLQDSAGFGAAEIIRRTIGLAHAADIDGIPDGNARAVAESLALNIARAWLFERHHLSSIGELAQLTQSARPGYPFP